MADEGNKNNITRADIWFEKMGNYLVERISWFATFMYLLVGLGMLYGVFIVPRFPQYFVFMLAAPFFVALVSYYNRLFAIISFIFLILFFFIL